MTPEPAIDAVGGGLPGASRGDRARGFGPALPPVGDRVLLRPETVDLETLFAPFHTRLYASGTAALAAALRAAVSLHRGRNEVILPAYGCPDLVAAALWAGARPVLVDLAPGRPWLDLGKVEAAIGPRTAAILAVDLLGIPERLSALRALARPRGLLLIEDSAQACLEGIAPALRGDVVVMSFGRGKPVGLLGGGALLYSDPALERRLCVPQRNGERLWRRRLLAAPYGVLRRPVCYGPVRRLPFLHLGETRLRLLEGVAEAPPWLAALLPAALAARRGRGGEVEARLRSLIGRIGAPLTDIAAACGRPPGGLLRYPLLVPPPLRDRLHAALDRAGLGSSILYPAPLPEIPKVGEWVEVRGGTTEARRFAAALLTLPVHDGVRPAHLTRMAVLLEKAVGRLG